MEVGISLTDSFAATGLELAGDQVAQMARATKGRAYLIQLVGYYVWQMVDAHREKSALVSLGDAELGVDIAMRASMRMFMSRLLAGFTKVPSSICWLCAMTGAPRRPPTSLPNGAALRVQHRLLGARSFSAGGQRPCAATRGVAIPSREYLLINREELLDRF